MVKSEVIFYLKCGPKEGKKSNAGYGGWGNWGGALVGF